MSYRDQLLNNIAIDNNIKVIGKKFFAENKIGSEHKLGNILFFDESFVEIEITTSKEKKKFMLTKNHWIPFDLDEIIEIKVLKNYGRHSLYIFLFSDLAAKTSSELFSYDVKTLMTSYSYLIRYPLTTWMFELWNRLFFENYMSSDRLAMVNSFCVSEILKEKYYLTAGAHKKTGLVVGEGVDADKQTDAAVNYLLENLDADISLEDIASEVELSISTLRRKFKKYFDISPMAFLTKKRMSKAYELLTTTNYTVGDVAFFVGYSDHSAFTTAFKAEFKVTPSEIKNKTFSRNDKLK